MHVLHIYRKNFHVHNCKNRKKIGLNFGVLLLLFVKNILYLFADLDMLYPS